MGRYLYGHYQKDWVEAAYMGPRLYWYTATIHVQFALMRLVRKWLEIGTADSRR